MSSRQGQLESFICAHDYTQPHFHPEGLSAILSQVHGNVEQEKIEGADFDSL